MLGNSLPRSLIRTSAAATSAATRWAGSLYSRSLSQGGQSMVELEEFRSDIRKFAEGVIAPYAAEIDSKNTFPDKSVVDLWKEMGMMGLHQITVPEADGGLGMGYGAHCIAVEEISRASASVGLSYGAHSNLCINQLARNGSEDQKERYLPALMSGDHVGALAMSEVSSGSDVMSMKTTAKQREDGSYVLNGTKMWITNGPGSDVVIVYAKSDSDPSTPKSKQLTAFILEKDMPGFSKGQKFDKIGMRGSDTGELVLEDVVVPPCNVLGGHGNGAKVLMSGLNLERLVLAAGPVGIMQAALDYVVPYTCERSQFGQPIGTFQLMEAKLADMYTATTASRNLVMGIAAQIDQMTKEEVGSPRLARDCAAAILFAAESATQVALQGIQALGGNGYMNEYPTGRFLRDAKLYEIGAGTSEIRRMIIGKSLVQEYTQNSK